MPARYRYPCGTCCKPVAVNHRAILCDICNKWIHAKCNGIDKTHYEALIDQENSWCCINCINNSLPFLLSDEGGSLQGKINNSSNNSPKVYDIYKDIDNIKINEEIDPILNNCLYYDLTEFSNISKENEALAVLHLNIASLALHLDELQSILANSNVKFDVIGITETGFNKTSRPVQNCEIEGYSHVDCTTDSNKGGVRIYISKKYDYKIRAGLNIYKTKELESVFVEIPNKNGKNFIIGCIYKHPKMVVEEFLDLHMSKILNNLTSENKNTIIMGDFNINLLNMDTDKDCKNFLEMTSSNSLLPLILKPTRFTTKGKTLIDNIFTNIIVPSTSGNITCSISDHMLQFAILNINTTNCYKKKEIKICKRFLKI